MKINKIELEMTEEEHQQYLNRVGPGHICVGIPCCTCPLYLPGQYTDSYLCAIRTLDQNLVNIKVPKPELKLYEGMDCSKLMFREVIGEILQVYALPDGRFAALYRDTGNGISRVNLSETGTRVSSGTLSSYDLIWK